MFHPFDWDFWYVWPIGLVIWMVMGWAEFGYFESRAIGYKSDERITLSYFIYYVGTKFPLSIFLGGWMIGAFTAGLAVHFLWHWCPAGSVSSG